MSNLPPSERCPSEIPSSQMADAAEAHLFIDLLGKDERHTHIRAISNTLPAKKGIFSHDLINAAYWNQTHNIYAVVNNGGNCKADINSCNALFVEWDDIDKSLQSSSFSSLGLPRPTFQVDTGGKSIHNYWVLEQPIDVPKWEDLTKRLIQRCHSDKAVKDASRVMRLAGFWYLKHGHQTDKARIKNVTDQRYEADCFDIELDLLRQRPEPKKFYPKDLKFDDPTVKDIEDALARIPRRQSGGGTYEEYRNILWALCSACEDVGLSVHDAERMMEAHSPSKTCGWNIPQIVRSRTNNSIGASTLFYYAKK